MLTGDRAVLEHSVELAESLTDRSVLVAALNNLALACGRSARPRRRSPSPPGALELCAEQGDRHREAALHNNLVDLLHAAGREGERMEHRKRAVAIFAEVETARAACSLRSAS